MGGVVTDLAALGPAAAKGVGLRHSTDGGSSRMTIGRIEAEIRPFGRNRSFHITSGAQVAHVVVPLAGAAVARVEGSHWHVGTGGVLVLANRRRTEFAWAEGSAGLVIRMPRTLLQEAVASAFIDPRRLGSVLYAVSLDDVAGPVHAIREWLAGGQSHAADSQVIERDLATGLVAGMARGDIDELFPVSRSLKRASDYLMANPDGRFTPAELAQVAGVTLPTLRRNVKECLGVPLGRFVERVRLSWINERLQSHAESRSVAQLARATGYHNSSTLARNYQRLFGETPTQTRSRAFGVTKR